MSSSSKTWAAQGLGSLHLTSLMDGPWKSRNTMGDVALTFGVSREGSWGIFPRTSADVWGLFPGGGGHLDASVSPPHCHQQQLGPAVPVALHRWHTTHCIYTQKGPPEAALPAGLSCSHLTIWQLSASCWHRWNCQVNHPQRAPGELSLTQGTTGGRDGLSLQMLLGGKGRMLKIFCGILN